MEILIQLSGALTVAKSKKIKLIHLEAGLRSFEKNARRNK